ncbi:hypothetical protein [Chamaesiphon minutus]|uniref:Uncharacterized protein n=1 Tax=Chamaesiphon minutus (strain ATCC 27169 / PCC 6605) TaxID=1173020 RepID=K9UC99_CHAP6|nr:hypothetical protein [Chamaesiphon minutus]AFY91819.1 hypothetical protein Cha6605_0534 [Chamaesiphon minutus PCC 6605]
MSISIETDLRDILNKLDQRFERMETNITDLKVGQAELRGQINTLDEKVEGQINTLDEKVEGQINTLDEKVEGQINALNEKVDGLSKRFDSLEFTSRGILIGLAVAIIAGGAKLFGFIPTAN